MKKHSATIYYAVGEREKQSFKFGIQLDKIQLAISQHTFVLWVKCIWTQKDYEQALSSYQLALRNTKKQPLKSEIQLAIVLSSSTKAILKILWPFVSVYCQLPKQFRPQC